MTQHDGRRASQPTAEAPASPAVQASLPESISALPETYGVDEVGVLCKDPWWYFVYWEVTDAGLQAACDQLGVSLDQARLVLRVLVVAGERRGRDPRDIRDVPVDLTARHGRRYLEAQRQNAVFRVAMGLLSAEGLFAPIAHSPTVRMPPQQPSSETSIEWLHVSPGRGDGRQRERIVAASHVHSERLAPPRAADGESHGKGEDGLPEHRGVGGASELVPALPPDRTQGTEAKDRPASAEVRPKNKREP